jgi:hypothetical protein
VKPFAPGAALACCAVVSCGSSPLPSDSPRAAEAPGRCVPALVHRTPAGWITAGKLTLTSQGGKPVSLEARDASGAVVVPKRALPEATADAMKAMLGAICAAGAVVAVVPRPKPPPDGSADLALLRPGAPNEAADVTALCTEPELGSDLDDSQKVRVAVQVYEETLTSPKWRGWLLDFHEEMMRLEDRDRAVALRRAKGAELTSMAAPNGATDCWFARMLAR